MHLTIDAEDNVDSVKDVLSRLLRCRHDEVTLMDSDGDEIPDWVQIPQGLRAKVDSAERRIPMRVGQVRFDLVMTTNDHEELNQGQAVCNVPCNSCPHSHRDKGQAVDHAAGRDWPRRSR